uniref:uncharacterized protein LOC101297803 n=1 Tax=Fragaria vesca subsp. vesca TaxID=101020 RepID=UPI0005C9FB37|nr:PREDICTED: uncharacterized protein LOC101297803 [Fragaria vesca subsp. vesca]
MAVIIRSPGNKTFSFGYPCVQAIVDHYLSMYPEPLANTYIMQQFLENFPNIEPGSLNAEYTVVNEGLLFYRQQSEVLTKTERVAEDEQRYKRSLRIMNNEDLNSFERDLIKLHGIVAQQSQELQQRQVKVMQYNNAMGAVWGFH